MQVDIFLNTNNGKAETIIGEQKGCIWCTPKRQAQEDKWSKRKPI
jgi:hypothetical protein